MSGSVPSLSAVWIVGSAHDCDIVVAQPSVSGRHCRLSLQNGQYVLQDRGSTNGTFVNGHRLDAHQPVYVSPEDHLTLGRNFPIPWPNLEQSWPTDSPSVQVLNIGRNPDCEVCLDYSMISWQHARITGNGKQWIIEDTNSLNGTALNQINNKIQRAILKPSDA